MAEGFQLSLHSVNSNSQRTVFTINMPPSFLYYGGLDHLCIKLVTRVNTGFFLLLKNKVFVVLRGMLMKVNKTHMKSNDVI